MTLATCVWTVARAASCVLALSAVLVGCSGVFDEVSPPEKRRVELRLKPDFVRIGETDKQIGAFLEVPHDGTFVTSIDMSDAIEVTAFDSRDNRGCPGVTDPPGFEDAEPYRLCVSIKLLPSAEVGERLVTVEVRVGNEPVLGESKFFVLSALE